MKKGLAIVLSLMLVLVITGIVMAQPTPDVSVEITPASDSDDRIEVELGDTVTLTATATLGSGNFTFVEDQWTNADRESGPEAGDTAGDMFVSTALFDANENDYDVGDEITVTYWIKVSRGTDDQGPYAEDDDDAYIEVVEEINGEITIVITPMAAPAVAAHILHFNEVNPLLVEGEGRNRTQVNMIAAVAHQMGPQTYFDCGDGVLVPKSIGVGDPEVEVSNPEYWEAVLCFLNEEFGLGLEMPDDDYLEGLME